MTDDESVLRSMIQHEDELRDQRLGWLFALNGFLFAALGFAWGDSDTTALVLIVAVVGVIVAVSSAAAMYASELAIKRLRSWSPQNSADESRESLPLVGLRSEDLKSRGNLGTLIPWLYPWRIVPWCLGVAWITVIVVRTLNT